MKKDIEWAKNRIKNTLRFEALNDREVGFKIAMEEALELINQLDEPEVLSQELIYEKAIDTHVDTANGEIQVTFILDDLQNILVPKQEEQSAKTVADVIADFYKSLERLKEVLGTEVEELEE